MLVPLFLCFMCSVTSLYKKINCLPSHYNDNNKA